VDLIEDELAKWFDPIEILPHVRVKKFLTNEGDVYVPIVSGEEIEKAIMIVEEIEDNRLKSPFQYNPFENGYYFTGFSIGGTMTADNSTVYSSGYYTVIDFDTYEISTTDTVYN